MGNRLTFAPCLTMKPLPIQQASKLTCFSYRNIHHRRQPGVTDASFYQLRENCADGHGNRMDKATVVTAGKSVRTTVSGETVVEKQHPLCSLVASDGHVFEQN